MFREHDPKHKDAPSTKDAGYYRVSIAHASVPYPNDATAVVTAKDEEQAQAVAFAEVGIVAVDPASVRVHVAPATEQEYVEAQAKRHKVNLTYQHDDDGKLTWSPPGHKLGKTYWVGKHGEILDKKEEEKK